MRNLWKEIKLNYNNFGEQIKDVFKIFREFDNYKDDGVSYLLFDVEDKRVKRKGKNRI